GRRAGAGGSACARVGGRRLRRAELGRRAVIRPGSDRPAKPPGRSCRLRPVPSLRAAWPLAAALTLSSVVAPRAVAGSLDSLSPALVASPPSTTLPVGPSDDPSAGETPATTSVRSPRAYVEQSRAQRARVWLGAESGWDDNVRLLSPVE